MAELKIGIIGVGNMGSKYAKLIMGGHIEGCSVLALTRIGKAYKEQIAPYLNENISVYDSANDLFDDVKRGNLKLNAVIITTPHYAHEEQTVKAFELGLHVLCDKPSGVYLRQANAMNQAAKKSELCYGMVFNQRTNPVYKRLKEIISSGIYGNIKRVNWIVTDWYRPDKYYESSSWQATWSKDGGGLLLNQCPHNLDLLQWICGMPKSVQGFCHNGKYHNIEVEDDVTLYMEWENGATGTFISSSGEAPGINRLEISLDEAMIVCESGELSIGELSTELGMKEALYRKSSDDYFRKIKGTWSSEKFESGKDQYVVILQNFVDSINGRANLICSGFEGRNSLLICNAAYLSSWSHKMIELPKEGSYDEKLFEQTFEEYLNKYINGEKNV